MTQRPEPVAREHSSQGWLRPVLLYAYIVVGIVTLPLAPFFGCALLIAGAIAAITGLGLTRTERIAMGIYSTIGLVMILLTWLLLLPAGVTFGTVNVVELGAATHPLLVSVV